MKIPAFGKNCKVCRPNAFGFIPVDDVRDPHCKNCLRKLGLEQGLKEQCLPKKHEYEVAYVEKYSDGEARSITLYCKKCGHQVINF